VAPEVKGEVSIELHNVRVRTQLDAVCESIGCRWILEPGSPPKLRVTAVPAAGSAEAAPKSPGLQERIDLKVTKADGLDVLKSFAAALGANLELDPAVAGEVTFNLEDTPMQQVLSLICQSMGCDWGYTEGSYGKAPVLSILKSSPRPKT